MNNLRKTAVLLLCGVFIISITLVPFTPRANVDSQVAAPTDYQREFIQKWAQRLQDDVPENKVDPVIQSYIDTGILDDSVSTTRSGATKLLLYLPPLFDIAAISSIAKVRWQIDLKLLRVASVDVSSIGAIKQLTAVDGIQYIQADYYLEPEPSVDLALETDPSMFFIRDLVGATGTYASAYSGNGVVVGVVDSGVDFSQQDMWNAEYNNGTYPMSYDPSSRGLTEMVIANSTYVSNTTAWLAAGNLLTYEMGGKYYLNVSGWDPVCNNDGSYRNLLGLLPPYGDGYPYGDVIGFMGLYEYAWGGNNVSEFVYHEMWKDWEIPIPTADNYTFGWAFQQKIDGYAKVFAPSMVYNGNLIIDWNGTLAFTDMWNWAIASQNPAYPQYVPFEIDLNTTADRDMIKGMMDWSFVDDIAAGYIFNAGNNILKADVNDDGVMDAGLGSLSWAFDSDEYLTFEPGLFFGITDDGMAWNALFTTTTDHGHCTASAIASDGSYGHDIYGNGTLYHLTGVAPGSKIIASKGLSAGGDLAANVWCMGFTLNETSGYWEYIGDGPSHLANMVSNSWGWGPPGMWLQLEIYTMVYDLASVPGVLASSYPGTLMLFSAGNEGNDYGTMGTPGGTFSVVSVGASMSNEYYVDVYYPYQPNYQQADFTSTGPAYAGYVKPDVMAPGMFGYSPTPSENDWLSAGPTYTSWAGTSLSCPIAAGVAALIMDAYNVNKAGMPTPQMTKDILLSTASDMGLDPLNQGHGFVNAEAACQAIQEGYVDQYVFESESFANYGDQIAESWAYWVPYWAPWDDIYYEDWFDPVGLESSSIFYGTVTRSEVKTVTLNIQDFAGNGVNSGAFDTVQPWYYTEASKLQFSLTGYRYNDTLNNVMRDGYFNLFDNMTGPEQTAFLAASYATIQVSFPASYMGITARLFDWSDTAGGTELNFWNGTDGDYLVYVSRDDEPNLLTLRVADPVALSNLFSYNPTLILFGANGKTVDVTIQVWQKTNDGDVVVTDDGATGVNATLTVAGNAEYGVHQGSIAFVDTSSGFVHEIPYSYTVEMSLDGAEGVEMTLVDGAGPEVTPYDTGTAVTSFTPGTTREQEGGGFTTFHIDIPYNAAINASVLVIRASWQNPGTVVDFSLRGELGSSSGLPHTDSGGAPYDPQPTGDLSNTIVWDPGDLINGTYWFEYYIHVFDGATVPEDIKITFQLYGPTALTEAENSFWWTSKDMTTPTPISPDDVLTADYIAITSNWTIPAVTGLPEYSTITGTQISLLSGLHKVFDGIYANPDGYGYPPPLTATDSYNWHTVNGIVKDDVVRVHIDSQEGADPAIQVYQWTDLNSDGNVSIDELGTKLLDKDVGTTGEPESGSFVAPTDMSIAILVYNFAYVYHDNNPYVLDIDTRVSVDQPSVTDTATYDTYHLLANKTMDLYLYCYTPTDVVWVIDFGKVTFNNFFAPILTVNPAIDLGDGTFNFTWSATDKNEGDSIFYSVWISTDGGNTYQVQVFNLTGTFFIWDSSGWLERDYYYRVRVYSVDLGIMVGGVPLGTALMPPDSYGPMTIAVDGSYGPFAAGDVPITTPPTTTTTPPTTSTTPPTTPPVTGLDPLLIGLIGGIGVGVVVLLILFLIRKK